MIIDCISDLHGFFPELEGGDILIVAGDITGRDLLCEWKDFFGWFKSQKYRKKILIAGNHDRLLEQTAPSIEIEKMGLREDFDFDYLCDTETEFEGVKIWGTPWTLTFNGVNPKCNAFMRRESFLIDKFMDIPDTVDVIVSHGPPKGILDECEDFSNPGHLIQVGSHALRNAMFYLKPKLVVFGHIHEQGGKMIDLVTTKCVNASIVNERYEHVNKPVRVML